MCRCVVALDFMMDDVSEAQRTTRSSSERCNQLSGGAPLSLLSNNQQGLPVRLQGRCVQEPPLGRSSPHTSVSSTWLLSHLAIRDSPCVISQHVTSKKGRHGSWDGCYSRATVFILSTAPKCTMWLFICPISSPLIYVLHDNICISLKAKCCKRKNNLHHNIPASLCHLPAD